MTVQNEASKRYNPRTLSRFLTREADGMVIVDRAQVIKDMDDERLFLVILNRDYRWGYKNFEDVTIYFVVDGKTIVGGVYNTRTKERETQRVIATARQDVLCYHYIYRDVVLSEIVGAIQNAPQRAK